MAHAKKSNYRVPKSRYVRYNLKAVKSTIITVIILAILTVILAGLTTFFYTPERIVKAKIESIAADYYENYFYQDIVSYKTTQAQLEKTMEKYEASGFSSVALRQLLVYDSQKHSDATDTIKEYCDESDTSVQFYPKAPYGQKDYHVEYYYSCEF